jgi:hypothetical protein
MTSAPNPEQVRLEKDRNGLEVWKRWGPYLSDRAWGTVREDYSGDAQPWQHFTHDQSRSRAYRWNEDGLLGISDDHGRLCLALAVWNGCDPIIKERLFGLTGPEGNHGEDVKEVYHYLESTPTHSYLRANYKYPQLEFPYARLLEENQKRGKFDSEFELIDSGVFDQNLYWDLEVEYAKAGPEDVLMRITAHNRGPESSSLQVLPTLWFRNTWSWGEKPEHHTVTLGQPGILRADHPQLGARFLHFENGASVLFCENETNLEKLYGVPNASSTVKDGINDFVVNDQLEAINQTEGSKVALQFGLEVGAGESKTVRVRLSDVKLEHPFADFDQVFEQRKLECDRFYAELQPATLSRDEKLVQRQAFAGMLWSKQYYRYDVRRWLEGDSAQPVPPDARLSGRNHEWETFNSNEIISMPDAWEYPWFAAWDLAFHTVPLALLDPEFAKAQLVLLTREWFQHPNGQLPAYEWNFSDVNPPVHAWATLRVYQIERKTTGRADRRFLERIFHKLLLNFNWWVNRKDSDGRNIFQGGFLGLDNISVFDRSHELPGGGRLEQTDGTAWMGMYTLNMLQTALELALENPVYEDIATKFLEHFLYIARALENAGMWDEAHGFYYDAVRLPDGSLDRLEVRSLVGLIPLLAVMTLEANVLERLPVFKSRMNWFLEHRPELAGLVSRMNQPGHGERHLFSLVRAGRMGRVLEKMLDENEFLSAHGIRSLSKVHLEHPFEISVSGQNYRVDYEPAESTTGMFGGNSNWRGPIWFPINYLLIESLEKFHGYYSSDFKLECPTGSGVKLDLLEISQELTRRISSLFVRDETGHRAVLGSSALMQSDPHWRDLIPFHEYFHGESGAGLGASHQTGWTGLIAALLQER